jgi:hypothetical protein
MSAEARDALKNIVPAEISDRLFLKNEFMMECRNPSSKQPLYRLARRHCRIAQSERLPLRSAGLFYTPRLYGAFV